MQRISTQLMIFAQQMCFFSEDYYKNRCLADSRLHSSESMPGVLYGYGFDAVRCIDSGSGIGYMFGRVFIKLKCDTEESFYGLLSHVRWIV